MHQLSRFESLLERPLKIGALEDIVPQSTDVVSADVGTNVGVNGANSTNGINVGRELQSEDLQAAAELEEPEPPASASMIEAVIVEGATVGKTTTTVWKTAAIANDGTEGGTDVGETPMVVAHAFEGDPEHEQLAVAAGERVYRDRGSSDDDGWTWVRRSLKGDESGYVPTSYLE